MQGLWSSFILTFVPLFIVIDALGIIPLVFAMTEHMTRHERHKVINVSVFTATIIGLAFLFFGQFILNVMGISVGSFAVAGGLILLILSIRYILTGHVVDVMIKEELVAVVPIGTPLLVGPATITTLLLLVAQFPVYMVLLSFILNIFVAWVFFWLGNYIVRVMGSGGLRVVSNVFNLLLAAIAVSMILRGLGLLGLINISIR